MKSPKMFVCTIYNEKRVKFLLICDLLKKISPKKSNVFKGTNNKKFYYFIIQIFRDRVLLNQKRG